MTLNHAEEYNNNVFISEETHRIDRLKVHLPNYLSGIRIFFHDIDNNTKQRLQRFVYAYVYIQ
jgi:hypothetical protein